MHGGKGLATVEEAGFRIWGVEVRRFASRCLSWSHSDCSSQAGAPKVTATLPKSELPSAPIAAGCWDPHTPGVVALAAGTSISVIDTRSMKRGLVNEAAHVMPARDVHYNPRRANLLVTCGDGCKIKFWDTRSMVAPLLEFGGHTHWVWQCRYNPFHDQLVLSSSSDTQVALWCAESVSSAAAHEHAAHGSAQAPTDGQVSLYDEHEESCYTVAWSAVDPWVFASASYDGRVAINAVPRNVRYRIVL